MVTRPDWPEYHVAATGGGFQITLEDSDRGLNDADDDLWGNIRQYRENSPLPHTLAAAGGFEYNGIGYEFTFPLGYDGQVWRLHEQAFRGYRGKYRFGRNDFRRTDSGDPTLRAGSRYFDEVLVPALAAWIATHQGEIHRAEILRRRYCIAEMRETIRQEENRHAQAQAARRAYIAALREPLVSTMAPPPPWIVDLAEHIGKGDVVEVHHRRPRSHAPGESEGGKDTVHVDVQRVDEGDGERVQAVVAGVRPGDTITLNTMPSDAHAVWEQMMRPYREVMAGWSARSREASEKGSPFDEPLPDEPEGCPKWRTIIWVVTPEAEVRRLSDRTYAVGG